MNTTLERLIEIEIEREQTAGDPEFQQWMKEVGVSTRYKDPEPILRAREMNASYDFTKISSKRSKLSSYIIEVLIK